VHSAAGEGAAGEGGGGGGGGGDGGYGGRPGDGKEELMREDKEMIKAALKAGYFLFVVFLLFNGLLLRNPLSIVPTENIVDFGYMRIVRSMLGDGDAYLQTLKNETFLRKVVYARDLLGASLDERRDLVRDIFNPANQGRSLSPNETSRLAALPESVRREVEAGEAGFGPPSARRHGESEKKKDNLTTVRKEPRTKHDINMDRIIWRRHCHGLPDEMIKERFDALDAEESEIDAAAQKAAASAAAAQEEARKAKKAKTTAAKGEAEKAKEPKKGATESYKQGVCEIKREEDDGGSPILKKIKLEPIKVEKQEEDGSAVNPAVHVKIEPQEEDSACNFSELFVSARPRPVSRILHDHVLNGFTALNLPFVVELRYRQGIRMDTVFRESTQPKEFLNTIRREIPDIFTGNTMNEDMRLLAMYFNLISRQGEVSGEPRRVTVSIPSETNRRWQRIVELYRQHEYRRFDFLHAVQTEFPELNIPYNHGSRLSYVHVLTNMKQLPVNGDNDIEFLYAIVLKLFTHLCGSGMEDQQYQSTRSTTARPGVPLWQAQARVHAIFGYSRYDRNIDELFARLREEFAFLNLPIREFDDIFHIEEVYRDFQTDRLSRTENDQALFNMIRNYLKGWMDNYTRNGVSFPKQRKRY